ncbi:MAG: hypothetical protein ACYC8T_20870 [Myxococcaceae bacterium]
MALVHDKEEPYALMPLPAGGKRAVRLRSSTFRAWISGAYYRQSEGRKAAGGEALASALGVLSAKAINDGPAVAVSVRIAEHEGSLYLDLANDSGEAVEIRPGGWRVLSELPVYFRREPGMLPLPTPEKGGTLEPLRALVNAPGDEEWRLLVAWLVAAMRPGRPFPVLVLQGEQGSAKSTTGRLLRALIDPAKPSDRARPRDERDLAIAARNAWVLAYDNLSGLPDTLSDSLCRVSTGAGFATRSLYSDAEEMLFDAHRPVMLNGIDELLTRPDLADRALRVTLPVIDEARRLTADEVTERFEALRPRLLGALCDAAASALGNLPQVAKRLTKLPRMADFSRWVTAAEPALGWPEGAFLDAYRGNRADLVESSLEADPVATMVRRLLQVKDGKWCGTAGELLDALTSMQTSPARGWPETPRALSNRLRRVAPFLRAAGVQVEGPSPTGHDKRRVYNVYSTVRTVRTVRNESGGGVENADGADEARTKQRPPRRPVPPLKADGADEADGVMRTLGGEPLDPADDLAEAPF